MIPFSITIEKYDPDSVIFLRHQKNQVCYDLLQDQYTETLSFDITPLDNTTNQIELGINCGKVLIKAVEIYGCSIPIWKDYSFNINSKNKKIYGMNSARQNLPWFFEFETPIFQWLLPKVYPGIMFYHTIDKKM